MKTITKQKKATPGVRMDPSLDKYEKVVLFPKKLALANERLAKSGFPGFPKKES